jgi:hypothetical protein
MNILILLLLLVTNSNAQNSGKYSTRVFSSTYQYGSMMNKGSAKSQVHGSVQVYGSAKYIGSGAIHGSEKKHHHGSAKKYYHGSEKYQGSTAIYGSAKKHYHGSEKYQGSTAIYGLAKKHYHGSEKYQGSTAIHLSTNQYGSINYNSGVKKYGSAAAYGSSKTHYQGSSKTHYQGSSKTHYQGSTRQNSYVNAFSPTISPTESLPEVYQAPPPTFFPTTGFILKETAPTDNNGVEVPEIPLTIQIQEGGQQNVPPNQLGRLLKNNIQRLMPDILTTSISKSTGLATKSISNVQIIYEGKTVNFTYIIQTSPQSNKYVQYKTIINSLGNLSQTIKSASNNTISINITHFYASAFSPADSINSSGQQSTGVSLNIAYYFMSSILIVIVGLGAYYLRKRKELEPSIGALTISPISNTANALGATLDDIPKRL